MADEKQEQQDTQGTPDAADLHAEAGREVAEDSQGTPRVVQTPADDERAEDVTPVSVVMAPQQWDDEAREFTATKGDPNADNVEAANAALDGVHRI